MAHCKLWRGRGEARGGVRQTEKEILIYKWGGGRAELVLRLLARGRTLNKVTLPSHVPLFFFLAVPLLSPVIIPTRSNLVPRLGQAHFPPA
jgi:hypothetical protein